MEKKDTSDINTAEKNEAEQAMELPSTSNSDTHRHHTHSSHRTHGSRQSGKIKHFLRENKKYLTHAAIILVLIISFIIVGAIMDSRDVFMANNGNGAVSDGKITPTGEALQFSIPNFDEDVVIVGPAVEEFMNADSSVSVKSVYRKYKIISDRLDVGLPVKLSYEIDSIPTGREVETVRYIVADNDKFDDPIVYTIDGKATEMDVYHLKTGTQYYYKVEVTVDSGLKKSVNGSFKTADTPRVLTLNGVYNLRDIGGWKTTDGQTVKQGLLYRGCEIDGAVVPAYKISDESVNTMLTEFGIKMDMDLRLSSDNVRGTDALGETVRHKYYGAAMYANILKERNSEPIREIFSDLADANNYPIYMHCTYGVDRTGTICYVLESLLGVEEGSLMKDYQLSGLHHGDVSSDLMSTFVEKFKKLPGDSLKTKAEGYLLSIGVTEEQIESIRSIFLEG
ncbi:MAG: tyrosine-protein phosphatase [Ruminococcaceae bacterium]|nr:tyrosine-protein phosphatase [Oscillospiraceae bacterium]